MWVCTVGVVFAAVHVARHEHGKQLTDSRKGEHLGIAWVAQAGRWKLRHGSHFDFSHKGAAITAKLHGIVLQGDDDAHIMPRVYASFLSSP